MKRILLLCLILVSFFAGAQEMVTLKFVRPSKFQGSSSKIRIIIGEDEYIIKNGGTISVNVQMEYYKPTRIDCKLAIGHPTSYFLHAKPGELYEFEVGFRFNGIYIDLKSGVESTIEEVAQQADSVLVDGKWQTKLRVDKDDFSVGFKAEKINKTEAIRQEWLARGGKIQYTSIMLTGTYFRLDIKDFGKMDGYGGGVSANMNWIKLKMPEFKPGISTWNSSNIGWGYDIMLYSYKYGMEMSMLSMEMNSLTMTILLNLNLGWTLGIGKYKEETNWRGVALTLKYKPSLNINYSSTIINTESSSPYVPNSTTTDSDGNIQFNPGGFGFDIDFTNFSAKMNKLAPKPKTKLSFFLLPPIGDSPLFVSVSLGLSFYGR